MDELEPLREQWEDVINIGEFVADQLVDTAKFAPLDQRQALLDGARAVQATLRQARKVQSTLGWETEGQDYA